VFVAGTHEIRLANLEPFALDEGSKTGLVVVLEREREGERFVGELDLARLVERRDRFEFLRLDQRLFLQIVVFLRPARECGGTRPHDDDGDEDGGAHRA
jgi:hypothetical protein